MIEKFRTIPEITRTVVAVQNQALGVQEYDVLSGVNIYARNSIRLLQSLGVDRNQLQLLIDSIYTDEVYQIDDSLADSAMAVLLMSHMLSTDLQNVIYHRLCEIINSPKEHRYNDVDVTVK